MDDDGDDNRKYDADDPGIADQMIDNDLGNDTDLDDEHDNGLDHDDARWRCS